MSTNANRRPLRAGMIALALLLTLTAGTALAQTGAGTIACGEERDVEPGLMTESTYDRMNKAFEQLGEEDFGAALETLRALQQNRLSDYEKASLEQALGFIMAQRENYEAAIEHFSEAVRLNQLPNQTHFQMILQIAQLYNAVEQYDKALEQLDFWFCISTEDSRKVAEVWVLKASLHAQKKAYRQGLDAIDQALEIAEQPRESWYRLKLGMLLELEDYRPAVEVAKILIAIEPDRKEYWSQLSGIYMELDENENAMAALQLAYRRGLLDKESDYTRLAGLLQYMDAPRLAAEVLQEGLAEGHVEPTADNWEMSAGAWYQARELDRALQAYDKAGELSESGKIDFQRASIMTAEENWEGVLGAAERALKKGDLSQSQEGDAYLLIGMAHFNLNQLDLAEQAFNRASNYGTLRSAANEWLNYVEQTRQRVATR